MSNIRSLCLLLTRACACKNANPRRYFCNIHSMCLLGSHMHADRKYLRREASIWDRFLFLPVRFRHLWLYPPPSYSEVLGYRMTCDMPIIGIVISGTGSLKNSRIYIIRDIRLYTIVGIVNAWSNAALVII